jgi:hypothetical protein
MTNSQGPGHFYKFKEELAGTETFGPKKKTCLEKKVHMVALILVVVTN